MPLRSALTRKRLEQALRLCKTTKDAADMLGVAPQTFRKRCQAEELDIPWRKGEVSLTTWDRLGKVVE